MTAAINGDISVYKRGLNSASEIYLQKKILCSEHAAITRTKSNILSRWPDTTIMATEGVAADTAGVEAEAEGRGRRPSLL